MLKIEMLTVETVGALKPLLLELADYHNQTALNFRGLYPLVCADEKIRTLQRGISAPARLTACVRIGRNGLLMPSSFTIRKCMVILLPQGSARPRASACSRASDPHSKSAARRFPGRSQRGQACKSARPSRGKSSALPYHRTAAR